MAKDWTRACTSPSGKAFSRVAITMAIVSFEVSMWNAGAFLFCAPAQKGRVCVVGKGDSRACCRGLIGHDD